MLVRGHRTYCEVLNYTLYDELDSIIYSSAFELAHKSQNNY